MRIAVLIPCHNEEITIASVVEDFKKSLLTSTIYVFDNNSTDRSAELAAGAGAQVIRSNRQGKGYVVRHMFQKVDADIYVMADGDGTYPAADAPRLIQALVDAGAGMAVGTRHVPGQGRRFHQFGNRLVAWLIRRLFNAKVVDVLSGYRAFHREFVMSVPLSARGFEVEVEMTLQAVTKDFGIVEIPIRYGERSEGSFSKLNTFGDGILILRSIFSVLRNYKPMLFFSSIAGFFAFLSVCAGLRPILDYAETRYVTHLPLAVLAASLGILAAISIAIAIVLQTALRYHNENFKLWQRLLTKQ